MSSRLRTEMDGVITRIEDDPYDPTHHSWIEVSIGPHKRRLQVTQRYREQNGLYEGSNFTWAVWRIQLLNFLLNPVIDVTDEFPLQD